MVFLSNLFLIFSKTFITLSTFAILFISQSFCGCSLILAPFAPPLLSEPLKVDADAHAVDTSWEIDNPDFKILFLRKFISLVFNLYFCFGTGSCQIKSSFGTSGPK